MLIRRVQEAGAQENGAHEQQQQPRAKIKKKEKLRCVWVISRRSIVHSA